MLLLILTAREGHLSSRRRRLTRTDHAPCCASKSLPGIAIVRLGFEAGARHSVKTGENAALSNWR